MTQFLSFYHSPPCDTEILEGWLQKMIAKSISHLPASPERKMAAKVTTVTSNELKESRRIPSHLREAV